MRSLQEAARPTLDAQVAFVSPTTVADRALTAGYAHAIGLGHEVGSLEPGKRADVIILDAPSYAHLGYRFGTNLVWAVVVRGRLL